MEKNQIFEKLNENIKTLDNIENEISMVQLAIYQKKTYKLVELKLNEIRELFEQQAIFYNQKSKKYDLQINKIIEHYTIEINKLVNIYDNLYINVFKMMQNAINNQKIAIANIATLSERLDKEGIMDEEKQKTKNTIIACAQKKLNYGIIVDECKERIKWCIENVQIDINQIFVNNVNQLKIYKDNIFEKVKRMIINKIHGGNNYKKFLENYKIKYLKDIELKNKLKILELTSILKGITKQVEKTKEQISLKYNI